MILKKWNEHPDKLKAEGEPTDYFETTEKECLNHTEGAGYYKKGTVLNMLQKGLEVRTPFAWWKLV